MPISVRPISAEELPRFTYVNLAAFGERIDPWHGWWFDNRVSADRTAAAFDGDQMVGTSVWYPIQLAVPGSVSPAAAISAVAVQPTHRRQGALRQMMGRLLASIGTEGMPIAGLWASEGGIYTRFGFGPAARSVEVALERPRTDLVGSGWAGSRRLLDSEMALQLLPDVHTRLLAGRPGIVGRDPASWRHLLTDPNPHIGRELGPLQILLHESAASADGYVLYRVGGTDGRGLRRGTLRISEMVATTPEAAQDLWRHCLDVDLVDRVEANWGGARPLDDPLFWLARDPQAIDARLSWTLWIRLLDVPKAMELRSYRADGTLVMEVQNGGGGADRLQLTVASGRARCTPTSLSPDLSLNLSDLGSAYLGNRCLAEKARAGAVAEITAGAAPAADALLSWDPPPWCFEDL